MVYLFSVAALALLPVVLTQSLTVNTPPSVVQCEPVQITWSGGSPPYFLSFTPAGQTSAPAIKQFPQQSGNSFTWNGDLATGTSFTIVLKDSSGTPAFSDIVTVQSGPDASCVNTSVTDSGSGGTATPTSGGASPSAPATTSGGATSGGSTSKPATSSASATNSAAPAKTSSPNAGYSNRGSALAVAGVMGLVGAALF